MLGRNSQYSINIGDSGHLTFWVRIQTILLSIRADLDRHTIVQVYYAIALGAGIRKITSG